MWPDSFTAILVWMAAGIESSYAQTPPQLIGNSLCLDLVNTVDWRGRPEDSDALTTYEELIHWSVHAGGLGKTESRRLLAEARRKPAEAQRVLDAAKALREAIARILERSAPRKSTDLTLLNEMLAHAPIRSAIVAADGEYRWAHEGNEVLLERPLWPVLWDAADLLASDRREWVRSCGDPECGWMFLDLSRNATRRWCSMEGCGNRAKARRHYQRRRKVGSNKGRRRA